MNCKRCGKELTTTEALIHVIEPDVDPLCAGCQIDELKEEDYKADVWRFALDERS